MKKDSYNGFSVALTRTMFDSGKGEVVISGAPRYNFTGGVVFFIKSWLFDKCACRKSFAVEKVLLSHTFFNMFL